MQSHSRDLSTATSQPGEDGARHELEPRHDKDIDLTQRRDGQRRTTRCGDATTRRTDRDLVPGPARASNTRGPSSIDRGTPNTSEISDEGASAVRDRIARDGLKVLAYRFDNDRWCTGQRFAAYQALLGDAFDGRVLSGSSANTNSPPFFREVVRSPHSVVTAHLVDEDGHPTLEGQGRDPRLPDRPLEAVRTLREQLSRPVDRAWSCRGLDGRRD